MSWGSTAITVDDTAILLEGVHHVHGCDGAGPPVLGVGQAVSHHSIQEVIDVVTHCLVRGHRDALDSASPGQSADGSAGDGAGVDLLVGGS